jgi:hypothetical protein
MVADGRLPKPVYLGDRPYFIASELYEAIARLPRARKAHLEESVAS